MGKHRPLDDMNLHKFGENIQVVKDLREWFSLLTDVTRLKALRFWKVTNHFEIH